MCDLEEDATPSCYEMMKFIMEGEQVVSAAVPTDKGLDKNLLNSSECYVLDCKVSLIIKPFIAHNFRMKSIIGWARNPLLRFDKLLKTLQMTF